MSTQLPQTAVTTDQDTLPGKTANQEPPPARTLQQASTTEEETNTATPGRTVHETNKTSTSLDSAVNERPTRVRRRPAY